MKRFHVHVSVKDLDESVRFYSTLFGATPSVRKPDYAKWMLEDPRVNFAISKRQRELGVNHLGLQVDAGDELSALEQQLRAADAAIETERNATCCYARSDKYWVKDPQGVPWETFHTLADAPVYGGEAAPESACCEPEAVTAQGEGTACCNQG